MRSIWVSAPGVARFTDCLHCKYRKWQRWRLGEEAVEERGALKRGRDNKGEGLAFSEHKFGSHREGGGKTQHTALADSRRVGGDSGEWCDE